MGHEVEGVIPPRVRLRVGGLVGGLSTPARGGTAAAGSSTSALEGSSATRRKGYERVSTEEE